MHRPLHRRARAALSACTLLAACQEGSPQASSEQLARAERIYTECVEDELGLELAELELSPGNIAVQFAPGTSEADEARALAVCEPRIAFVLEPGAPDLLGPPENLGRPASDAELAALVDARTALGFEGAVLIETGGDRRLERGAGRLRDGAPRAPDLNTAFDCGSIMKQVTAALIFLLEQEGALSREQTLNAVFPEAPAVWGGVSVDQILRHRAGFHAYHDTEGDFEHMDREQATAAIFAQEPRFPPGTQREYSNSGYTLLAIALERIAGRDYRDLARDRIFEPLHMRRTGFYGDALWSDGNVAVGRGADQFGANDPARWPEPSWALMGNGGLVSTLEDLLRMARAFEDDSLFAPETREAFWASHPRGEIDGRSWYAYAGGNDFGFQVLVGHVPQDRTFILVASHVLAAVTPEILGIQLLQSMYGAVAVLPE